ncbi:unnamed protein product, partial [Vitis vinifera]|uniref:Uncharacterized protein n=1 Tax=Vitis vinifera TaxID=29760 RepID=D7TMB1_VITVI
MRHLQSSLRNCDRSLLPVDRQAGRSQRVLDGHGQDYRALQGRLL